MTREEALVYMKLYRLRLKGSVGDLEEDIKAYDMAIEALKAESCEDAVSREDVKNGMIKYGFHAPDMTVNEFVTDLPSVQPIPVMYYPQVTGVTPYVVAEDMRGGE